jgi:integrase
MPRGDAHAVFSSGGVILAKQGVLAMAVRHEVENLIRRGNIFYWRPRIPSCFAICPAGSRLSLSLQISDHKKAQVIARRLNLRLAELKQRPKEAMSTKEQLQKLFQHIRDDMLEELDDVSTMAKRNGRAGNVEEMELDLEVGWAYQLLAKFGTRVDLSLEGGCAGLAYLLANNVPVSHIAAIKANYLGELKLARSSGFEERLRLLIYNFEIPDTILNREKAMSRFFEGRAAALLEIDDRHALVDRSLSEFTGGRRADAPVVLPAAATPDTPAISVTYLDQIPKLEVPVTLGDPSDPRVQSLDLNPRPRPASSSAASPPAEKMPQRIVPLDDFENECNNLIANMGKAWDPSTGRDAMALVRMFKTILEEHGVEHSGQIEQYHIGKLRQHFNDIPTDWGRSSRMRILSAPDLRDEGRKLREAAAADGTKARVGLSAATIRKHIGNLNHFLKHLRGHGFQIEDWTFEGLRPRKPKAGEVRLQQYKPTPQDIAPIFASPIYTGSLSSDKKGRKQAGPHVFHDSLYFLPILFTYLGARRKEFAALAVNDIAQDDHGVVIILRENKLRRIKNIQSDRKLPMPDELIRLGFLEYYTAIKKLGYEALFPDLFSDKTDNDPGDRFYDTFVPIMQDALGKNMWGRALHALRHGMADTLKQAGVSAAVVDDIAGRLTEGSETNTRYTNPASLPLMRSVLSIYPIITSCIEPKPLQLLPWIENRQPPPWAREGKK